jgi:transposase
MEKMFELALGIEKPLYISKINFNEASGELHVHMDFERGGKFSCSKCNCEKLPVHDTSPKTWRHLNFFQHKCFIHLRTPRTNCNECGVTLWTPSWVRLNSGFTLLFEAFVLTLAKSMPMTKISQLVDEHDTRLWRIINHHVGIAKAKKDYSTVELVGCDETSRKKGHNYVTVFADMKS